MTTRLTIEIQRVPFDNIEPLREYPGPARPGDRRHRLQGAACGHPARAPPASTACIDTFALSPRRSTSGSITAYSDVKLPHKFKIAVGGCPNNCVKPDLNDLGIDRPAGAPSSTWTSAAAARCARWRRPAPSRCAVRAGRQGESSIASACNHCGRCVSKCPFNACGGASPAATASTLADAGARRWPTAGTLEKVFTEQGRGAQH